MYQELIRAAYRRTRHNEGDKPDSRYPGGFVSTYDVTVNDPKGWQSWLELLARADIHHPGSGKPKLDLVRTCEALLAKEAGL
jgi:hypothetical protein